ncbi:hypothetical protein Vadar_000762 [Vaccinium darrowii]|uniref:Uncharacterized protein n=1 Tax=Vaccinium darrowii TaxID=229202 RepID=A0ACB7Y5A5_9ERIC|nr:hypothetical protein Vadar_000762 [Vaccinium darrowii]
MIALYERAAGIYASLVNINAYHQPGVEAGKKAAGEVLALQKRVLSVLNEASCKDPVEPLSLEEVAERCHAPEDIEMIYKIIAHMSANDRALIAEGSCGSPRSIKVFLGECNLDEISHLQIFFSSTSSNAATSYSLEMKVVAAYLLAVLGGNASPCADDLKDILGAVGAEADDGRIELLLSEVKGKDITELIASGREKLASVPAGGGGGVAMAAVSAAGGGGAAAAAPAAEAKKEEKVEEKEESDDDMGFSLFD